jgi:hypothetical protein
MHSSLDEINYTVFHNERDVTVYCISKKIKLTK